MTRAVTLLLAWYVGHYLYKLTPLEIESDVSNIGRSLAALALLGLALWPARSPLVWPPATGIAAEEVQVVGCTLEWLRDPWISIPGQDRCSEALLFPMAAFGLAALGVVAVWLLGKMERDHGNTTTGNR